MIATLTSTTNSIAVGLQRLRRRLTWWIIVEGLGRWLAVLLGLLALDLLLDWSFHMDRPQRIVMLGLLIACAGYGAWRWLWRPLSARISDDALCLEIERQNPELGESLISAAQFLRMPAPPRGASPEMVVAVVDRGLNSAGRIDFRRATSRRRFAWNGLLLVATLIGMGCAVGAGLAGDALAIWFNRNVLLGSREWPQDLEFHITGAHGGVLTIPRGDDWPLEVVVTPKTWRRPEELWLEIRGDRQRRRMESLDGGLRFQTLLAQVDEPLEFRVSERLATSGWTTIDLVERPVVENLELTASPPSYTGAADEALPPGGGPYKVLTGSRLRIRGQSSKPLSAATVAIGDASIAATSLDGNGFTIELPPEQVREGEYSLEVRDTESLLLPGVDGPQSLASRAPATFRLKIAPDREPRVEARLSGVGNQVTALATIPIAGRITDDFAISAARLSHRWRREKAETDTSGAEDLAESLGLPANDVRLDLAFALEPLQLPEGTSLTFQIEAEDNRAIGDGPGQGRSTLFLVRVVSPEELLAALLARERELRTDFETRIKSQDELRTDGLALLAGVRGRPQLDVGQRDQLTKLQKRQKGLGDDLVRIARRFEEIVIEMRNNRIEEPGGALQTRLTTRIVAPLWSIADESLASIAGQYDRARLESDAAGPRDARLEQIAADQQTALDRMREILGHMQQAEGFQEAVNMLIEVQKAQQDVRERTEKEKQEAIRRLLDGK